MPTPRSDITTLPADYEPWLAALKTRISASRGRAAVAVNRGLILLYWEIGREILARQDAEGYGTKVIDRLAADLSAAFPSMKGFSARNLKYMRAMAFAWPDTHVVQQVVAQLPWGHQTVLLDRLDTPAQREWYARAAIEHGWSRNVLVHQIDSHLIARSGTAVTNFSATLPAPQSALAQQLTKDPHIFDFLGLGDEFQEQELEDALVGQLQRFLMELGKGFSFVGRQYHLEVGGQDYYIDLLFYHLQLHCYFAIELKIDEFKPEYVGKMQFYLAALDGQVKTDIDGPSIGLILCRSKNSVVAEYALRDARKPVGVSEYRVTLPRNIAGALPTVQELEQVMQKTYEASASLSVKFDSGASGAGEA